MPDRHYDLAGQLLADAVADSSDSGAPIDECLHRAARATGRAMGLEARTGTNPGDRTVVTDVLAALGRRGYEPCVVDEGEIALSNCPFHRLAEVHRRLVCGMNLDLLTGLVDGMDPDPPLSVRLDPEPGSCCVRLSVCGDRVDRPSPG